MFSNLRSSSSKSWNVGDRWGYCFSVENFWECFTFFIVCISVVFLWRILKNNLFLATPPLPACLHTSTLTIPTDKSPLELSVTFPPFLTTFPNDFQLGGWSQQINIKGKIKVRVPPSFGKKIHFTILTSKRVVTGQGEKTFPPVLQHMPFSSSSLLGLGL